jgi:multiple sugar transport system ATP-binding protein
MIYVTHDQVEAMTLATRVAVMRGGRIQQIGTPGEVYARPANLFVAGFLGSPSMNFVDGEIAGRAVTLGVRPEHVALHPADSPSPQAEIALVEAMGAHEVVWLDMAGHKLAAIAPADDIHRIGDSVGVQMDLDRAIVFDPVSQERIELDARAFRARSR